MIPGIGPRTAERLATLGIETIADLQRHPPTELARRFGERLGASLADRAHFRDGGEVATRAAKSRSVETTFDSDVGEVGVLERVLAEQARRLAGTVRTRGIRGRTIGIKVRLDDFSTHTRARSRAEATNEADVVRAAALDLLREFDPRRPVRLIGVRVAGLDEDHAEPAAGQLELAL